MIAADLKKTGSSFSSMAASHAAEQPGWPQFCGPGSRSPWITNQ